MVGIISNRRGASHAAMNAAASWMVSGVIAAATVTIRNEGEGHRSQGERGWRQPGWQRACRYTGEFIVIASRSETLAQSGV